MKIDRRKFVLLALSLSSVACVATTEGNEDDEEQTDSSAAEVKGCIAESSDSSAISCQSLAQFGPIAHMSSDPDVEEMCSGITHTMKSATLGAAKRCMKDWKNRASSAHAIGRVQWPHTSECAKKALRETCRDPSVDLYCAAIVKTSARKGLPTTTAVCRSYLSGLNTTGRKEVLSCVTHSYPFFGFNSCVEGNWSVTPPPYDGD